MLTRWILVAGTGRQRDLPITVLRVAEELGRRLAAEDYGLICGGWPGVDYVTANAFAEGTRAP